jgi:hypothetical protein
MAERADHQHEWIDNVDSDDYDSDSVEEGNAQSKPGDNLGRWFAWSDGREMQTRSEVSFLRIYA